MFDAKDKKEKGLFHRSLTVILAVLITVSMMPASSGVLGGTVFSAIRRRQ